MTGLGPVIHEAGAAAETWMAGTSPAMTALCMPAVAKVQNARSLSPLRWLVLIKFRRRAQAGHFAHECRRRAVEQQRNRLRQRVEQRHHPELRLLRREIL